MLPDSNKILGDSALQTIEYMMDLPTPNGTILHRSLELFQQVLRLWHPSHPRLMFNLANNYPDLLLSQSNEVLITILSDLMDGCQYLTSPNARHEHLKALFELIKSDSKLNILIRFRSIGGPKMLESMESGTHSPETEELLE